MDRLLGEFAGGRWIFVTGNGAASAQAVRALAAAASVGCHRLVASPSFACYRDNESPVLTISLVRPRPALPST
jgi:hypothetical protein